MRSHTLIAAAAALSLALGSGAAFAATTTAPASSLKGSTMTTRATPATPVKFAAKTNAKAALAPCKSLTGKKLADCTAKAKVKAAATHT